MLVCTHTLQKLKRCFRTAERHKRYDYNSSHVQSQSFGTEQWPSAANQVQSSQRWVEPNQRSVPNQCSNIMSFSGPNLSAHAKFDRPRHSKPRVLARRDFYFRSVRTLTGQQMKKSVQAASAPQVCQICFLTPNFTSLTLFRDSWRQKDCSFFSEYLAFLEAIGTCYQTGVFAFSISFWKVLVGFFR